jgi:type IV pilus assembly protein PilA
MKSFFANRSRKRGFTLIELLVVVLILAILMAVALPLYLSAVADSETKTCRANMQTIANAVQANRVKTRASTYYNGAVNAAAVASGGALEDLQSVPQCPNAGTYSVDASTAPYTVHCSVTGHEGAAPVGFTPGVDAS